MDLCFFPLSFPVPSCVLILPQFTCTCASTPSEWYRKKTFFPSWQDWVIQDNTNQLENSLDQTHHVFAAPGVVHTRGSKHFWQSKNFWLVHAWIKPLKLGHLNPFGPGRCLFYPVFFVHRPAPSLLPFLSSRSLYSRSCIIVKDQRGKPCPEANHLRHQT